MAWEYPMGFKFLPSDDELITCYLTGLVAPLPDCILQQDIYSVDPQSLNWDYVPYLSDYERYYFVKRSQVAKKNGDGDGDGDGGGKNANRSVGCGVGFWRMSCGRDIKDAQNKVIGHCQSLNYYRYMTTGTTQQHSDSDHHNMIRNKAHKTQWLMHEYTFATHQFQEWVICRVKDQDKERGVKEGRYNIKRRRQADHDDVPPPQRPRHAHHNHTSIDLADHGDDDFANQLEHQIQASNDLADHGGDGDYHDHVAPPSASMSECSIISQSPPPPPPPEAEHIHQLGQPQDDDDVDFYLQNLPPLEEAEDHQPPQYLFLSNVPVFDDDDDNFNFIFDSGSDKQNYEDQADA